jgi:hypothetical protein
MPTQAELDSIATAKQQGATAWQTTNGDPALSQNPYRHGSPEREAWDQGWIEANEQNA